MIILGSVTYLTKFLPSPPKIAGLVQRRRPDARPTTAVPFCRFHIGEAALSKSLCLSASKGFFYGRDRDPAGTPPLVEHVVPGPPRCRRRLCRQPADGASWPR